MIVGVTDKRSLKYVQTPTALRIHSVRAQCPKSAILTTEKCLFSIWLKS